MNLRNKAFWIAFFVGLATSAKINHIIMLPALLFWAWPRPELNRRAIFMAILGLLLGLLPALFFLLRDPQSFYVNNFEFHILMNIVRGLDVYSSVRSIVLGMLLFSAYNLIPLLVILLFLYSRKGQWHDRVKIVFLLFSCFILAIAPMVLFAQYLCVLTLFLLFFSVRETELAARGMRKLAYLFLLLQLLPQAANIFPQDQILSNEPFAVSNVAAIQKRAAENTAGWQGCERKVFTTHPLFYLDRKAIYPAEAGAGPYWYMVRSGLPHGYPARQHIAAKLTDFAPNIVVYGRYEDGIYRPNEDAIEEYARQNDFRIIEIGEINDAPIMMGLRKLCI
jgi:hypothetical protein